MITRIKQAWTWIAHQLTKPRECPPALTKFGMDALGVLVGLGVVAVMICFIAVLIVCFVPLMIIAAVLGGMEDAMPPVGGDR